MSNSSDAVNPEVIQPQKLEDSFDYVMNRLHEIRERTAQSDRQVYRAVGDFATAAQRTANAADELLTEIQNAPAPESLVQRLSDRWQELRQEADELLCRADNDAAIDRVLKLEQLVDRIERRLIQLVPPPADDAPSLEEMTVSELKAFAKAQGITGYSKLNKKALIDRIKTHLAA
jgi:hypothetical protein